MRQGRFGKVKPIFFLSLLNQLSRSLYILSFQFAFVQVSKSLGTWPSPLMPQYPKIISVSIDMSNNIIPISLQIEILDYKIAQILNIMSMMERTQSWERDQEAEQQIHDQAEQVKNKQSSHIIEEIVSERVTEEIVDDLTALRNKQNKTPLVFYGKIGSSYLFSYKKTDTVAFLARFFCFALFIVGMQTFVQIVARVSREFKIALICCTAVQILSFLLLYFLDPGTLFDDQQQKIDEQRLYCQTCRVYRSHNSHHCVFCVKCVKGYDHHCGFFSKCIGRRNYLLFCLFLISCGVCGAGSFGSLLLTVFKSVSLKAQQ